MLWLNLLHLYQPANIDKQKLVEATEKSYERILRALEEHPEIRFTLNIAGCLLIRWDEELGRSDLIKRFKKLLDRGQIELTGSAAYHALLPLVTAREAERQILEQEKIIRQYFGRDIRLNGFFLPELAFSPAIAGLIKKLGYRWLILDQISSAGKTTVGEKYADQASGLEIIFRDRKISESFVPETIAKNIGRDQTIITCSDAELYGLRHLDQPANFEKLLKRPRLKTATVTDFLDTKKTAARIKLRPSSWQSTEQELKNKEPYALWQNKKNDLHMLLWRLADLAQKLYWQNTDDENHWWARWHLVRGLSSCAFWWTSAKDFRAVYGPLAWNPDEIEKGTDELIRAIRSLESSTDLKTKLLAEKLAAEIKHAIWQKHWSNNKRYR